MREQTKTMIDLRDENRINKIHNLNLANIYIAKEK